MVRSGPDDLVYNVDLVAKMHLQLMLVIHDHLGHFVLHMNDLNLDYTK